MFAQKTIHGTGEEISRYVIDHPQANFLLIELDGDRQKVPTKVEWQKVLEHIESNRGKFPVLPFDATSTDSLYD